MTDLTDLSPHLHEHVLAVAGVDAWERDVASALADVVAELVDGVTTTEEVPRLSHDPASTEWGGWRRETVQHVVHHPPLLEQLARAVEGSSQLDTGGSVRSGIPGSRPSARLDALAVAHRVDRESTTWALRLGVDARVPVFTRLLRLVPQAVEGERVRDDRGRTLLQATRSWRAAARVTTGWDSRPIAPRVPCPEGSCEEVGTLRIRLVVDVVDDVAAVTEGAASCLECGATWDADLVLGLYEYVRWAADHELHTAVRPVTPAVLGPRGVVLVDPVEAVHEVLAPVVDEFGAVAVDGRGRELQQLVACGECAQAREQMAENRAARAAAAAAHVATGELMPVQAVEGAVHDEVLAVQRRHAEHQAALT